MERISKIEFPIHLRARDVVLLAREARENGTLQCMVKPGGCSYYCEDTKTQCAVGQAFTPEAAQELQRRTRDEFNGLSSITTLLRRNVITSDKPDALVDLQAAHDRVRVVGEIPADDWDTMQFTIEDFDKVVEKLLAELPE